MIITLNLDSITIARYKRITEIEQELISMAVTDGIDIHDPKTITSGYRSKEIQLITMKSRYEHSIIEMTSKMVEKNLKQKVSL